MTTKNLSPELLRVVDANTNRLKEAIRVVEDIARYYLDSRSLSLHLKELRHRVNMDEIQGLLDARDSINDVLKTSTDSEMQRDDLLSIITANFKRAQESSRVLEEIGKLISRKTSANFKEIRYMLYALEKELTNSTSNSK
jgi:hypothetical protein